MNDCEYCNLNPGEKGKLYSDNTRVVRDLNYKGYYTEKNGNKYWKDDGTIDWINYCPMCGRSLN